MVAWSFLVQGVSSKTCIKKFWNRLLICNVGKKLFCFFEHFHKLSLLPNMADCFLMLRFHNVLVTANYKYGFLRVISLSPGLFASLISFNEFSNSCFTVSFLCLLFGNLLHNRGERLQVSLRDLTMRERLPENSLNDVS